MTDQPQENAVLKRFHSGLNLNSVDVHAAPSGKAVEAPPSTAKDLPALTVQQEPTLRRLPASNEAAQGETTLRRVPAPKPVEPVIKDEDVARPHRSKLTAGQELSNMIEIPSAALSGYIMARRGSQNVAESAGARVVTLTDHAIPQQIATDFNISREDITARIKSKLTTASATADAAVSADPSLLDKGYRFEFEKANLADDMIKKLHRPGDLDEVLKAIDNVPKTSLTVDQLQQVSEYSEHLGKSPLLQQEDLTKWTGELDASASKFSKALADAGPEGVSELTEAGRAANLAEKEFYGSLQNLRANIGLSKHTADSEMQELMKTHPTLFETGRRFEFDPSLSPEKVAELKRPEQLKGLLTQIERTHAPGAEKLITSQGEHLAALKGLSENPLVKSEGLTEMAASLEKNAGKIIESRGKAFNLLGQEQATFMKTSLMTLGAGIGINYGVDKIFFRDQTAGVLTHGANILGPAILLSNFKPQIKLGVIVGSHLLARIAEKPSEKHWESSYKK
ncbi:hypothetical protein BH11CYA1_BH11CYA1_16900 [soil metagenome]